MKKAHSQGSLSREGAKDSSSDFGRTRAIAFSFSTPLKPRCEGAWLTAVPQPAARLSGHWALFCSFPDQEVRRMAMQWIGSLSDAELLDYLPQLVQVGGLVLPPVLPVSSPISQVSLPLRNQRSQCNDNRCRLQAVYEASYFLSPFLRNRP